MTKSILKFREIVMREVPFARMICPVCHKEVLCLAVKSDGSPRDKSHKVFCPGNCKKPKTERDLNREKRMMNKHDKTMGGDKANKPMIEL